jgi:outer membrane immunogenic protein
LLYGRAGLSFSDILFDQAANSAANESAHSNTYPVIGGRFGAGINYQISQHIGAGLDYFYAYFPQTDPFSKNCAKIQSLSSHYNYIGFSLFYTV